MGRHRDDCSIYRPVGHEWVVIGTGPLSLICYLMIKPVPERDIVLAGAMTIWAITVEAMTI